MAWSFTIAGETRNGSRQKSAVQLQREAAVVLALGGGFQAYYQQRRDGSVPEEYLPVMAEVAKFCRARQAVCQRAEPVPQVALLYSTAVALSRDQRAVPPRPVADQRHAAGAAGKASSRSTSWASITWPGGWPTTR